MMYASWEYASPDKNLQHFSLMVRNKHLLSFLLLLPAGFLTGQNTADSSGANDTRTINVPSYEFVMDLMKEYSPDTYHMLTNMSKPRQYSGALGSDPSESVVMHHIGMFVHESCHDYDFDINQREKMADEGYFIDPKNEIPVHFDKVFSSYELNKVVPDSLKKKIQRYNTYIGDKQRVLGAQKNGIYGLMEEMCAYYRGAVAYFDLKPWYEKTYGYTNADPWVKDFIPNAGGDLTGFYEFRIYMAWYLDYAKKNYPEQYKAILANDAFRKAFTLLYDNCLKLAELYEKEVYIVEKKLNDNGQKVVVEEKYFEIHKPGEPIHGYGHHLEAIRFLKELFTPELEASLMVLRNRMN